MREPSEERSRISRRRRGSRLGLTLDAIDICWAKSSSGGAGWLLVALNGWSGGIAEDCGAGGEEVEVVDIVWKYLVGGMAIGMAGASVIIC